jgi:hypothetical protein
MGYASADSELLICKQMKEGEAIAVFQAMLKSGTYIRIRFGGGVLTLPDPCCSKTPASPQGSAGSATGLRPHAFYPDQLRPSSALNIGLEVRFDVCLQYEAQQVRPVL